MKFEENQITMTDQYKANGHFKMLLKSIRAVKSYFECRPGAKHDVITFVGLQPILKKYFVGKVITLEKILKAERILRLTNFHEDHFNKDAWIRLLEKHKGILPLRIRAVPEGTRLPVGNVNFTIESTDDEFPWLGQRFESLLMHVWYPIVIATKSRKNRKIIEKYLAESSDSPIDLAKHLYIDFGYRGVSCDEQGRIGGMAHLVNCVGSDTIVAVEEIDNYYGPIPEEVGAIAYGVPASEHCISMAYGPRPEDDERYFLQMLKDYPDWIVSIVGDTQNIVNFVGFFRKHKELVLERWRNGKASINKAVLRPDSPRFEGDTAAAQVIWIHDEFADIFGFMINSKGKKVLHPAVGCLYGDGVPDSEIEDLYRGLSDAGYSVESQLIGQGGGLLVKDANRDTERVAIKPCQMKHDDGFWHDVIKNPLDKSKKSKSGDLKLVKMQIDPLDVSKGFEFKTINQHHPLFYDFKDELVTVFENGELLVDYNFIDIRKRSDESPI
jgi:nicotinamide phosphoribosyltransferase